MSEQPSPEPASVNLESDNPLESDNLELNPDPQDSGQKPPARVTFQDIFSMGLFIFLLLVVVFLGWNLVQALLTKAGS